MTDQNATAGNIFSFDPFALETPGKDSRYITKVPGEEKPLICKILPDPTYANGKSWFRPIKSFGFLTGPNPDTDMRMKVCMSFFGEHSPENDAHWEYKKQLSELKKAGKGNSTDAAKLKLMADKLYPKEGGWLFFIEPESPTIKALRVPASVLHILNGKEASDTRPAIPSLIKGMAADGVSPFDVGQQKPKLGWLKIWKTGAGMATRYHVAAVQEEKVVEVSGKKYSSRDYVEMNVHEKILKREITMADLPNVVDFERKFAWTHAECLAYVESACTKVPERFLKTGKKPEGRVDETDEAAPTATVASLDALPKAPNLTVTAVVDSDDIPFA